ncbi:hypothetical protein ABEB36_006061 [Hypothenemus hampei]|uniref:Uncharacterized protein n=1 Tax=Hypothenemus hampei TaxID=57062 RepID=A0ABD1F0S0_HYPHA
MGENNEDMEDEQARCPKDNNEDMEVIKDEPARLPEENNENRNNRRPRKRDLYRYAVCKMCNIV